MRYWITTHWPPRDGTPEEQWHRGVWVPDGKQNIIHPMAAGDCVFIYEATQGRTLIRKYEDGTETRVACQKGRGQIIALARVADKPYELEDSQTEEYADGSKIWWRYFAPTETVNSAGSISRRQAATILGYSEDYTFRGFGDGQSGLKQIDGDVFEQLKAVFDRSVEEQEIEQNNRAGHARGPGGEGPAHLALKQRIAANPARILDEPGLKLVQIEWSFPTGDRIDVLLKDRYGRFVAVEVEVDCDERELIGPLQCMKYRAMLAYYFNRPLDEFRTILVAHSIHGNVRLRCNRHNVEHISVARIVGRVL